MYKNKLINNDNNDNPLINNFEDKEFSLDYNTSNIYVNKSLEIIKEVEINLIEKERKINQNTKEIGMNILDNSNKEKKELNSPTKKKLGRKIKNSNIKGLHDKYSQDNIIKKIKSSVISNMLKYINSFINKIYKGNIGHGVFKKELLIMNQSQIVNVKNNKKFLHKKLKDIFSEDISDKYTHFFVQHNKILIQSLLNEKDEEKRIIFNNLFMLTFLDCLNHFSGKIYIKILDGLECLNNLSKKFEDDQDYMELFIYNVLNFEQIIMNKRERNVY